MRKKIIAANWKMYGTLDSVKKLTARVAEIRASCEIIIFPPFLFIPLVQQLLKNTPVHYGGQNLSVAVSGPYTGEISSEMLKEYGCSYVLVGHSERRRLFYETNTVIGEKFIRAQAAGLIPILCVGETLEERNQTKTMEIVLNQFNVILERVGVQAFETAVLAYEPVWAIGTGLTATPLEVQEVHLKLRKHIHSIDAKIAESIPILYGGSIKPENAGDLLSSSEVDGGLVGGASLNSDEFRQICLSC